MKRPISEDKIISTEDKLKTKLKKKKINDDDDTKLKYLKIFKQWTDTNLSQNPSKQEKKVLAEKTGLSIRRVQKWFADFRRNPNKDFIKKKIDYIEKKFKLKKWIEDNQTLYPTYFQQLELVEKIGLTLGQIKSLFYKYREALRE